MDVVRANHTATLLPDGRVLVAAGQNGPGLTADPLASALLYLPLSGTWTATGDMATARTAPTATLLGDGTVLVAGGSIHGDEGYFTLTSAELYHPVNGTWTATGSMVTARAFHTATVLPDGRVLVAGGTQGSDSLASAELYDPVNRTWTATGNMATARAFHTATLLPDASVLVVDGSTSTGGSGQALASAELYDPGSGTWTATGQTGTARALHTAVLLPDGRVLAAGGSATGSGLDTLTSAELYDPVNGTWTATGNMVAARVFHTATVLPDGRVLVVGGLSSGVPLASAELYDPASGT